VVELLRVGRWTLAVMGCNTNKNWKIKINEPISELFYILLALLLVDLTVSSERSPLVDT
jgi:predicted membrane channel-forming protein YqfA (hemolysin III family)